MPRGKKQIEGQLTFEDFCMDIRNFVVQHNTLVSGKQNLKLNSAKLIRSAIMQIKFEDQELKPYIITIKELSSLLGIPASNIYRDIEDITDDIIQNPVYIREEANGKTTKFVKIPWVTRCDYKSDVGIAIKLNEELKPYLIQLKNHYTEYTLDEILSMKSIFAIRIFELIQSKIMYKTIPQCGLEITITIQEIRECCNCEDKYEKFSHLKEKVIDKAVDEINKVTLYNLTYEYIKNGRTVVALKCKIVSCIYSQNGFNIARQRIKNQQERGIIVKPPIRNIDE